MRRLKLTACSTSEHSDYTSTERCAMRNLVLKGKSVWAVEAIQGTGLSEAGHAANMMRSASVPPSDSPVISPASCFSMTLPKHDGRPATQWILHAFVQVIASSSWLAMNKRHREDAPQTHGDGRTPSQAGKR